MKIQIIKSVCLTLCLSSTLFTVSAQNIADKDLVGYLFAYFEGSGEKEKQEQLRFAVSENAVNWFALNGNQPIMPSKDISQTGGIRDPHILRGADGKTFYIVECYYMPSIINVKKYT